MPSLGRMLNIAGLTVVTVVLVGAVVTAWMARGPLLIGGVPRVDAPRVPEDGLRETVRALCGDFSPRGYGHVETLDAAASWIAGRLRAGRLVVEEHPYTLREGTYRNVIATLPGSDPTLGAIVVGAHYDAYGDFPGADDNASGIAVLTELARLVARETPRRPWIFAAFGTEEPPFFGTDDMGSARFAGDLDRLGIRVDLMIALDLVGYYSDRPGSQSFPLPGFGVLYPTTGSFVAVVGDLRAGSAIRRVKRGMQAVRAIPVRSFRAPSFVDGVDWSDHLSFRRRGIPAVLVTDTAFLRNPNYHTRDDTPDTLDYRAMGEVVRALYGVLKVEESAGD
jgi:hypothetical protein